MNEQQDIDRRVVALEQELALPANFFEHLFKEDDWSFVIKLHALVEAATSRLIVSQLGRPELHDFVARLELSGTSIGKAPLATALGVFDSDERRFTRALSELRNSLVHRVENVRFSFPAYVESLDKNQKEKFYSAFGTSYHEGLEIDGRDVDFRAYVLENPKLSVWMSAMLFLALVHQSKELAELRQEYHRLLLEKSGAKKI